MQTSRFHEHRSQFTWRIIFFEPIIFAFKFLPMWNTQSYWFEVSIVTMLLLLGHIFLGHFEERSPSWRKLLKFVLTLVIVISLSAMFNRTVAFVVLGIALLPVIYIHAILFPKINAPVRRHRLTRWDQDLPFYF